MALKPKVHGELAKPLPMTASNTYTQLPTGSAPSAKAPMKTQGGRHPGTKRMEKMASTKACTSRKSQQGKGSC